MKLPSRSKKTLPRMLTDPGVPLKIRRQILLDVCRSEGDSDEERDRIVALVLEAASRASAGEESVAKAKELAEILAQLRAGPLRCATFDRWIESERLGRRAEVILPDGSAAFCAVADEKLGDALRCGDTVWLDAQAQALLFHQADDARRGEEGRLERRLAQGDVLVSVGEVGRFVFRPSARLVDQLERGEAAPGSTLVVCPRRMMAFHALPPEDGLAHLRFLAREPVPDVVVERDVGAPPPFLDEIESHVRRELVDPATGRRYGLRRSRLVLATGVPGSGKSHCIEALWRRLYELGSEATGVDVGSLPPRVLKLRASEVLSKWVGSSDRNLARFFDEVEQVAAEPFVAPDGRRFELPVLVICEEIDALARQRGQDSIHDRIQATLLTRLDPARPVFRDRVVIVVCTTNVPGLLDMAFVRRAGGDVARFGHLDRFRFRAVLEKHVRHRPFRGDVGGDAAAVRRCAIADLAAWLFAPHAGDRGLVEIAYVGRPQPEVKHRRDFLTAGLVDRAVQRAAAEACDAEWRGAEAGGLTTASLARALDAQVRHIVDQLTPESCAQYLTLPDAVRVGTVRRLPQPPALPLELERAS